MGTEESPAGGVATASADQQTIERYPDGSIPASERYIDYRGQVVIRTRYATIQRFKQRGPFDEPAPSILPSSYCREDSPPLEVRNPELEPNELSVTYIESGDEVLWEVLDD